jgi:hypothetical protein
MEAAIQEVFGKKYVLPAHQAVLLKISFLSIIKKVM